MQNPPEKPIYLDNNATTPLDPRVFAAMQPYFLEDFGNAMSAQHAYGWTARTAIEKAREECARLINAQPREITFTSGATESIHLAILGFLEAAERGRKHIITTAVEHKCVLEVAARAEKSGHEVTILPVDRYGRVELATLENAIRAETALVSVIHANNEIGSVNAITEIGALCRKHEIALHVDAAQSLGKLPIDVRAMNIDLLSASAHKIYGPKGAGFLFTRLSAPRVRLSAYLVGGGQEKGLRGGTHNVPAIVGFGCACDIAQTSLSDEGARLAELRDRLAREILAGAAALGIEASYNGHPEVRLPNNVSLTFTRILPDEIALALSTIAYSSASACSSGDTGQSHVLAALGVPERPDQVTVRFGLGRFTTAAEIDKTIKAVLAALEKASVCLP